MREEEWEKIIMREEGTRECEEKMGEEHNTGLE